MKKHLALLLPNLFIPLLFSNVYAQWDNDTLTGGKIVAKNLPIGNSTNYPSGNVVSTIPDDKGGALLNFLLRFDTVVDGTYYSYLNDKMQHCDTLGNLLWGTADSGKQVRPLGVGETLDFMHDGQGGIYLFYSFKNYSWTDSSKIYLQHINNNGQSLLPDKGFFIANTGWYLPGRGKLCFTSDGNIAVVWRNVSNSDRNDAYGQLFAQKISIAGEKLWGDTSLNICTDSGEKVEYYVIPDASGGIFVLFEDSRNGQIYNLGSGNYQYTNLDIYKQHISFNGSLESGRDGLPLAGGTKNQRLKKETSAAKYTLPNVNGGFYFIYYSSPDSILDTGDLYIQQLNAIGEPVWNGNGKFICRSKYLNDVYDERLLQSPSGNLSVVYAVNRDYRVTKNYYLQLQTITSSGAQLYPDSSGKVLAKIFAKNGVTNSAFDAKYCGEDTLLFIFKDKDSAKSIRIQKLLPDGTLAWDSTGKTFIRQKADMLQLIESDYNHFIIQWVNNRNHSNTTDTVDVFMGKIDTEGNIITSRRTILTSASGDWNNPLTWVGGIVPGQQDIVVINHSVNVSSDASCYSLRVQQPGGAINVQNGFNLIIVH